MTDRAAITDRTYRVNSLYVSEDWLIAKFQQKVEKLSEDFCDFIYDIKPVLDNRFITMQNKDVWLDKEVAGLYPFKNDELRYFRYNDGGTSYLEAHKEYCFDMMNCQVKCDTLILLRILQKAFSILNIF